jgi:transcriptional regulator with XRE-family HTH domain
LRAVLAAYDFGPVFRAVRQAGKLSQEELGLLVGLSQARVSDVERGRHRLRSVAVIARVAGGLGIPGRLLGFDPTTAGSVKRDEEVRWVDRRDFFTTVTAITLGMDTFPDLERLEALLPHQSDPPTPRRIGAADVAAIEGATAAFRLSDRRHGGGLSRAAAVAQLGYVLKLQDAACSDQVRADLLLATADLAGTAAWMTYDVEQHDAARRLWMIALDTARQADDHPRSTDLTVHMLQDMVHQALHLGRPEEALRLVQLGAATATNRAYPVNASTRSYIATNLAWCHASLGEAESCHRALDQAQQIYTNADPATVPPWAAHIVPAAIAAQHGHSLFLLSRTDPGYAPAAIEHLRSAVGGYARDSARSRAAHLPGLAGSYFLAGEVDSAIATGHEAVTAISTLSSTRAYARLRTLADTAEPHRHQPDVAELRERIRGVLATTA